MGSWEGVYPAENMRPVASVFASEGLREQSRFGNQCVACGFGERSRNARVRSMFDSMFSCCRCGLVFHKTCCGGAKFGFEFDGAYDLPSSMLAAVQAYGGTVFVSESNEDGWIWNLSSKGLSLPQLVVHGETRQNSARCPCCIVVDTVLAVLAQCVAANSKSVVLQSDGSQLVPIPSNQNLARASGLMQFVTYYNEVAQGFPGVRQLPMLLSVRQLQAKLPTRKQCSICREITNGTIKCSGCPLSVHPQCINNKSSFCCDRCSIGAPIASVSKDQSMFCYACMKPLHHKEIPTDTVKCSSCSHEAHNSCVLLPQHSQSEVPVEYQCSSCDDTKDSHADKLMFHEKAKHYQFSSKTMSTVISNVSNAAKEGPTYTSMCAKCTLPVVDIKECNGCSRIIHLRCGVKNKSGTLFCEKCAPYALRIQQNAVLKESRELFHLELMNLKAAAKTSTYQFTYTGSCNDKDEDEYDADNVTVLFPMQSIDDKSDVTGGVKCAESQALWDQYVKAAQKKPDKHPNPRVERQLTEQGRIRREEGLNADISDRKKQIEYDARLELRKQFFSLKEEQLLEREQELLARQKRREKSERLRQFSSKTYSLDSEVEQVEELPTSPELAPQELPITPPLLPTPGLMDPIPPSLELTLPYHAARPSLFTVTEHKTSTNNDVVVEQTEENLSELCHTKCAFCHRELDYDLWNLVTPVLSKDLPVPVAKTAQKNAQDKGLDKVVEQTVTTAHAAQALLTTLYPPPGEWKGRFLASAVREDRQKVATVLLDQIKASPDPHTATVLLNSIAANNDEQFSHLLRTSEHDQQVVSSEDVVIIPPGLHPLIPVHAKLPVGPVLAREGGGSAVHYGCAYWSPLVYQEHNYLKGIVEDIRRAKTLNCAKCGICGASVGCFVSSCPKSYHIDCACDPETGCLIDYHNFNIYCPDHWIPQMASEIHQLFDDTVSSIPVDELEWTKNNRIKSISHGLDNEEDSQTNNMSESNDNHHHVDQSVDDGNQECISNLLTTSPTCESSHVSPTSSTSQLLRNSPIKASNMYSYLLSKQLTFIDFVIPHSLRKLHQYHNHLLRQPEHSDKTVPVHVSNSQMISSRARVLQGIYDGITKRVPTSGVFDDHRLVLKESLLGPALYPEVFSSSNTRTGLLLSGPSGCGKTHFIKDLIHEYGCVVVSGGDPGHILSIQSITQAYQQLHTDAAPLLSRLSTNTKQDDLVSTRERVEVDTQPNTSAAKKGKLSTSISYADNEQYKYDFDSEDEADLSRASKLHHLDSTSQFKAQPCTVSVPSNPLHFLLGPQLTVFVRSAGDLLSRFNGETERQIRDLLSLCEACAPSMLVIEELDALAPVRNAQYSQNYSSIVTTLQAGLDGVRSSQQAACMMVFSDKEETAVTHLARHTPPFERKDNVQKQAAFDEAQTELYTAKVRFSRINDDPAYFLPPLCRSTMLLCTTSRERAIDPALRRPGRLDLKLSFDLPSVEVRRALFEQHVDGLTENVLHSTQGYSISECIDVCTQAKQLRATTFGRSKRNRLDRLPLQFQVDVLRVKHPQLSAESSVRGQDLRAPHGVSVCTQPQFRSISEQKPPGGFFTASLLDGLSALQSALSAFRECPTTTTLCLTHAHLLLTDSVTRQCFTEVVRDTFRGHWVSSSVQTNITDSALIAWEEHLVTLRTRTQHRHSVVLVLDNEYRDHPEWISMTNVLDIEDWSDVLK